MPNTSASGGYLVQTSSQSLPGNLSLEDFLHSVIVGISGLPKTLVRPKWQVNPPKQPDINVNWIAFGIQQITPDANAYIGQKANGSNEFARTEKIDIQLSFYGSDAMNLVSLFRDGFQIQQNLESLRIANMGFNGVSQAIRGPDLLNQRWVDRWEMTLTLVRTVQRVYPILLFASAAGTINTILENNEVSLPFNTENV